MSIAGKKFRETKDDKYYTVEQCQNILNDQLKIVAAFDDKTYALDHSKFYNCVFVFVRYQCARFETAKYHKSYDWQILVWQKFCKAIGIHADQPQVIELADKFHEHIDTGTLHESFAVLVKAIELYNKITNEDTSRSL